MGQFELSLGTTVGLCVRATLFTLIPLQSVQRDWRAIIRWYLKERKTLITHTSVHTLLYLPSDFKSSLSSNLRAFNHQMRDRPPHWEV